MRARPSAVGLDVLESVVHESAGAARVNLVAVNELLLGEGLESAGGDLDGALTQMKDPKDLLPPMKP